MLTRLSLSTGLSLTRAGGSGGGEAPAHEQLLTRATDDGWTAFYDPTNPDTRTLRDDGGDQYFSANADGLENWSDVEQTTAADQPQLISGHFGDLDGMLTSGSGASGLVSAATNAKLTQPVTVVTVIENDDDVVSTTDSWILSQQGTNDNFDAWIETNTAFGIRAGNSAEFSTTVGLRQNKVILAIEYDGAQCSLYLNSKLEGTLDGGTNPFPDEFKLMNLGSIREFNGKMGPFGVLNEKNATKRVAMQDLLHTLTGIAKA